MKKAAPELDYSYDVEPYAGLVLAPQMFSAVQYAINFENRSAIPLKAREITIANGTTLRRIIKYDLDLLKEYNKVYPDISIKTFACATINDEEELETLIKMGIDGIQTDKPELLKQAADKYQRKTDFKGYDISADNIK